MLTLTIVLLLVSDSFFFGSPFFGTRKRALPYIIPALKINDDSICVSLGCGNANLLRSIRKYSKNAKLIGVEKGILLIILARLLSIGKNIKIFYGGMLSADVKNATHIYLYAGHKAMDKFEDKFINECKDGTRIVSFDSMLPNLAPVEHVVIDNVFAMVKNVYVYELKK